MLAYLTAENEYADAAMAPLSGLRERLYDEMVGRLHQDDSTVPYFANGYGGGNGTEGRCREPERGARQDG